MSGSRILVVDDEESIRWTLGKALEKEGYGVRAVGRGEEAISRVEGEGADLVLLDIKMPDRDGLEVLSRIKALRPDVPVIMMTAFGTMQVAVEAMKKGAYDYITKPFDLAEVVILVGRALEVKALTEEVVRLRESIRQQADPGEVVGRSAAMQEVFKLMGKVAGSDLTVLITGESGTGKELVARAIHFHSRRADKPFVAVNCAAVPRELLESELFGHEKGAFTGATAPRRGKFELAEGGTLFLDEIGDMDLTLQTKILRVLQEREFERVGGERALTADVRIIAATNQDLEEAARAKRFREDLFYRLNVVTLSLPPLRERKEDIPLLLEHFLHQFAQQQKREPKSLSKEARDLLLAYDWPGNVRELENVIKRACVLATTSLILPEHLPLSLLPASGGVSAAGDFEQTVARAAAEELQRIGESHDGDLSDYILSCLEKPVIEMVLKRTGGNQVRAAEILGINRNTLRSRMARLGIPAKPRRPESA